MYDVLSPDGLPINPGQSYKTLEAARAAAEEFANRFIWQGFYSTAAHERIPLEDIVGRCRVVPWTDDE